MTVRDKSQLAFDEQQINDPDLEAVLEEREKKKASKGAVSAQFTEVDKKARDRIGQLELPNGAGRCGRFRITLKPVGTAHVEFDTKPSRRVYIKADGA